jgi:hypothetical protein
MKDNLGKPAVLMTRDELTVEIVNRPGFPALVIFQEEDITEEGGLAYRCRQSFNDRANIATLLRTLADYFEGCSRYEGEPDHIPRS